MYSLPDHICKSFQARGQRIRLITYQFQCVCHASTADMKRARPAGSTPASQKSISSFFRPTTSQQQQDHPNSTSPASDKKRDRGSAQIDLTSDEDGGAPHAKRTSLAGDKGTTLQDANGKQAASLLLNKFSQPARGPVKASATPPRGPNEVTCTPVVARVQATPRAPRVGSAAEKVRLREKAQYKLAQATRRHSDSAPAQPFTPLEKQIKDLKLKHPGILLLVEVRPEAASTRESSTRCYFNHYVRTLPN